LKSTPEATEHAEAQSAVPLGALGDLGGFATRFPALSALTVIFIKR
jgi:hypothetical protein